MITSHNRLIKWSMFVPEPLTSAEVQDGSKLSISSLKLVLLCGAASVQRVSVSCNTIKLDRWRSIWTCTVLVVKGSAVINYWVRVGERSFFGLTWSAFMWRKLKTIHLWWKLRSSRLNHFLNRTFSRFLSTRRDSGGKSTVSCAVVWLWLR